ncbi:MAG: hypothetical protein VX346_03635, partial [Planctomycetota bacterium]|nr:hypothetical protein [Planctomycetota bacterium]
MPRFVMPRFVMPRFVMPRFVMPRFVTLWFAILYGLLCTAPISRHGCADPGANWPSFRGNGN